MSNRLADLEKSICDLMAKEGYAYCGQVGDPVFDGIGFRFRSGAHPVLTERLRPITVTVSGLEILNAVDLDHVARSRVEAALST